MGRAILFAVLVAAWEAGARAGVIDPYFVSRPSKLAATVGGWFVSGFIYPHVWATVQEATLGLAVGIVGGVIIGMLFAFFPFLSGLFHPLMVVFNATPRIALAPLFIVWLGIGLASKVAMVVSLVFFIIFFSTYAGLRDVDVNLINHVRVMGGTRRDLMRHVLLPSALTWIFASLRTCVGFAVIGAIIGEYLGADRGIGWIVQYGESLFDSNMVISGLVVLMIFVATLDGSLGWLERRFSHWKQKPL
ncbi:MAG TPA: ABC transporter permease [Methylomirabilota bacterium]|nr:ABC transporter permease [Methylomirabilota bacterium]